MKKILFNTLIIFIIFCSYLFLMSACENDIEQINNNAKIISATDFTFDDNNGKITVSNDTEIYSFINQIEVSDNATWVISTDIYGMQTIATKTIPLNIGDNTVYLLVTSGDGNYINLYTITVRRRPVYTVSFNTDDSTKIAIQQIEEDDFVIEPTVKPTKAGYNFIGWNYDFNLPIKQNIVIYAKWSYFTVTTNKNISAAGSTNYSSATNITTGNSVTITATTNKGYSWLGWYNNDIQLTNELSYTFDMPNENVIYTAKWIDTPVTLNKNIDEAGIVSITDNQIIGKSATISAATSKGYTFIGWYYGDTKLTDELEYTFNLSSENKIYTAKWTFYTITVNKNIALAGSTNYSNTTKITAGDSVTVSATINNGYSWLGWYDGETKLTNELSYTFDMPNGNVIYTAKWIDTPVALNKNIDEAGALSITDNQIIGKSATISATTNNGYTFIGWYYGDAKLTDELEYTFNLSSENKIYIAKWTFYTLTTDKNIEEAGDVTVYNKTKITAGRSVTITANINLGYTWLGWYDGEKMLTEELTYTFDMPDANITYTAKSQISTDIENFYFTSTAKECTIIGTKDKSLTEIIIPDYVTEINQNALSGCSSLVSLTIPFVGGSKSETTASNKTLFGYIFGMYSFTGGTLTKQYYSSSGYRSYYIPSSLRIVNITGGNVLYGALSYCSSLTSISLGNDVTSIGDSAFCWCTSLTSVTIGNSITSIGYQSFYGCSGLINVTIGHNVASIGNEAFVGCSGLISISIPSSVTYIGRYALFTNSLTSVVFENPNGWKVYNYYDTSHLISISSNSLSNASTAATCLTSQKYGEYYWQCYD